MMHWSDMREMKELAFHRNKEVSSLFNRRGGRQIYPDVVRDCGSHFFLSDLEARSQSENKDKGEGVGGVRRQKL